MIKTSLNPEGHQNPTNGSKVTAILLKGWISPVGGASAVEGLRSTGLPRLVLMMLTLEGKALPQTHSDTGTAFTTAERAKQAWLAGWLAG